MLAPRSDAEPRTSKKQRRAEEAAERRAQREEEEREKLAFLESLRSKQEWDLATLPVINKRLWPLPVPDKHTKGMATRPATGYLTSTAVIVNT